MDKMQILTTFTSEIMEFASNAKSFASEQAPIYIQELLSYMFYENAIIVFFLLLAILFITVLFVTMNVFMKGEKLDDRFFTLGTSSIIYAAILGLFIFPLIKHTNKCIKVKIAPRVVIVDELKSMMYDNNKLGK